MNLGDSKRQGDFALRPKLSLVAGAPSGAKMSIQNRIGILRRAKGMSQTELADAIGTTRVQIHRLEHGARRLSLDWMERVARALNVKISDLLPSEEGSAKYASPEEEILGIVAQLSEKDQLTLVKIAREILHARRRWESELSEADFETPDTPTDPKQQPSKRQKKRA